MNGSLLGSAAAACTRSSHATCFEKLAAIALPRRKEFRKEPTDRFSLAMFSRLVGVGMFIASMLLANAVLAALYFDVVPAIAIHTWH